MHSLCHFFFLDCFGSSRSLAFSYKFQNHFLQNSTSLVETALNCQINLGRIDILTILTILSLPIHEYGIYLFLKISLHIVLWFFSVQSFQCRSCTFFVKINKWNSKISFKNFIQIFKFKFSNYLLLVYKNTIDFCMLTLYPETSLNPFTSSNSCFVNY